MLNSKRTFKNKNVDKNKIVDEINIFLHNLSNLVISTTPISAVSDWVGDEHGRKSVSVYVYKIYFLIKHVICHSVLLDKFEESKYFNRKLAKVQIKRVHCLGLLEARSQCLQGNWWVIWSKHALDVIFQMTICACILHNLLISHAIPKTGLLTVIIWS